MSRSRSWSGCVLRSCGSAAALSSVASAAGSGRGSVIVTRSSVVRWVDGPRHARVTGNKHRAESSRSSARTSPGPPRCQPGRSGYATSGRKTDADEEARVRRGWRKPGAQSGSSVVIIGGGFAGLSALNALASAPLAVTLVDRNVYSTFQPLLYQVATAGLTSSDVAYPLWSVTRKTGARFHKGLMTALDTERRVVRLDDGTDLAYDYLILATGVSANFFGIPGAAQHSMSLYTRRDAVALRERLLAELEVRSWGGVSAGLDVTIAGGGATGVELAGTL